MKILLALRLFSGFEDSIRKGQWSPSGAPAIYKLIDALNRKGHDLEIILTVKENPSPFPQKASVSIPGFSRPWMVLPGYDRSPGFMGRIGRIVTEVQQAIFITRHALQTRPDLIYVSNANFLAGSLLARYTSIPVALRIMGVSGMADLPEKRGWLASLVKWAYRSPFSHIIATRDGSNTTRWLEKTTNPNAPRSIWLNGVDLPVPRDENGFLTEIPPGLTRILFIGRLEPDKGCREFIHAFSKAFLSSDKKILGIVVGNGSLLVELQSLARELSCEKNLLFLGSVPHAIVQDLHKKTDTFVSLNRFGNLSNVNLEAMRTGNCMIIPAPQSSKGIDIGIEEIIPSDAAIRFPAVEDTSALAQAILWVHEHPKERLAYRARIQEAARINLLTWEVRVEREISLLQKIVSYKKNNLTSQPVSIP